MSQVNVTPGTTSETSGDRSAAAGINMITVLIVLFVLAVLAWFLFTGPLRMGAATPGPASPSNNTVNVNNPPANPPAPGGGAPVQAPTLAPTKP